MNAECLPDYKAFSRVALSVGLPEQIRRFTCIEKAARLSRPPSSVSRNARDFQDQLFFFFPPPWECPAPFACSCPANGAGVFRGPSGP